jgi:hypothetical protein
MPNALKGILKSVTDPELEPSRESGGGSKTEGRGSPKRLMPLDAVGSRAAPDPRKRRAQSPYRPETFPAPAGRHKHVLGPVFRKLQPELCGKRRYDDSLPPPDMSRLLKHHGRSASETPGPPRPFSALPAIPGHPRPSQAMPSHPRPPQPMPGHPRPPQATPGHARPCQAMPGNVRQCQAMSGHPRPCQAFPALPGPFLSPPLSSRPPQGRSHAPAETQIRPLAREAADPRGIRNMRQARAPVQPASRPLRGAGRSPGRGGARRGAVPSGPRSGTAFRPPIGSGRWPPANPG